MRETSPGARPERARLASSGRRWIIGFAGAVGLLVGAAGAIASVGAITYEGCMANKGLEGCAKPRHNSFGNNTGVAVSPDSGSVYVVTAEGSITRLERRTGGGLAYRGCFADEGRHDCRDIPHDSIDFATGVAVSPDGRSVYVTAGQRPNSVVRFKRGESGRLEYGGCISNGGAQAGAGGCKKPPRNSLDSNEAVAVSPDGTSVYVASSDSDSITRFGRAANGALRYRGCIANRGARGCVEPKRDSLGGAFDVAVSPDGASVYVVALNGDAVSRFDRAPDGSLTYRGCVANARAHGCRAPDHDSLGGADAIAVSPDSKSVYVASLGGHAVTRFDRSPGGRLTSAGCFANRGAHGCREPKRNSLNAANGIAVSPDGESVYATGMTGPTLNGGAGALTRFSRHRDGSLGYKGCFADRGKYHCKAPRRESLNSPASVAVSPDGAFVYVGSFGGTLSIFRREVAAP